MEGVRGRWTQRSASTSSTSVATTSSSTTAPVEVSLSEALSLPPSPPLPQSKAPSPALDASPAKAVAAEAKERIATWGTGIGSFFSARASKFSVAKSTSTPEGAERGVSSVPVATESPDSRPEPSLSLSDGLVAVSKGRHDVPERPAMTPPVVETRKGGMKPLTLRTSPPAAEIAVPYVPKADLDTRTPTTAEHGAHDHGEKEGGDDVRDLDNGPHDRLDDGQTFGVAL